MTDAEHIAALAREAYHEALPYLTREHGHCIEVAMAAVAAARALGIPATFCYGLLHEDGRTIQHAWCQLPGYTLDSPAPGAVRLAAIGELHLSVHLPPPPTRSNPYRFLARRPSPKTGTTCS